MTVVFVSSDNLTVKFSHTILLICSQAVLGPKSANGEVNVIQAEAMGYKSDIKFPITVLTGGQTQQVVLDLLFPDPPVTFKLIQGNGPVHLLGNHSVGCKYEFFIIAVLALVSKPVI